MLSYLPLLIAASIFITVSALALSVTGTENYVYLRRRVSGTDAAAAGPVAMREATAPRTSIGDSLVLLTRRFLPEHMLEQVQHRLVMAGNPTTLSRLMIAWFVGIIGLPLLFAITVLPGQASISRLDLGCLFGLIVIGYMGPKAWLDGKVRNRQKEILRALPDAIDLLLACIESGLGIDSAFDRVAEKARGPLADELRRALGEMSLGRSRREALSDVADRLEIEDFSSFVAAIIQAETVGASLGGVLRVHSEQMRIRRKQRAEKKAYEAPVKMVIPLVLFIFPAMFIVILGPAIIEISHTSF